MYQLNDSLFVLLILSMLRVVRVRRASCVRAQARARGVRRGYSEFGGAKTLMSASSVGVA